MTSSPTSENTIQIDVSDLINAYKIQISELSEKLAITTAVVETLKKRVFLLEKAALVIKASPADGADTIQS